MPPHLAAALGVAVLLVASGRLGLALQVGRGSVAGVFGSAHAALREAGRQGSVPSMSPLCWPACV